MRTLLTRDPDEAAAVLRRGGLCVLPTETVYGLAALAYDADAVRRVFEAKGRPSDNPLIVHLGEAAEADEVAHVTALGGDLLRAFTMSTWFISFLTALGDLYKTDLVRYGRFSSYFQMMPPVMDANELSPSRLLRVWQP